MVIGCTELVLRTLTVAAKSTVRVLVLMPRYRLEYTDILMGIVGIVEIAVGIGILTAVPVLGAYVASAWLLLVAVNVIAGHLDVAVRDVVLSIAAFTLARLSQVHGESEARPRRDPDSPSVTLHRESTASDALRQSTEERPAQTVTLQGRRGPTDSTSIEAPSWRSALSQDDPRAAGAGPTACWASGRHPTRTPGATSFLCFRITRTRAWMPF